MDGKYSVYDIKKGIQIRDYTIIIQRKGDILEWEGLGA